MRHERRPKAVCFGAVLSDSLSHSALFGVICCCRLHRAALVCHFANPRAECDGAAFLLKALIVLAACFVVGVVCTSRAANQGRADLVELLLKCFADIDAVNTAGLSLSDVTEWDGRAQQDGQNAASAAVATGTNMQETSGVTSLCGAASSTDSAATPAAAAGGEEEAGSSAESKGSLVCPKCARVYVYQFRSAFQHRGQTH